MSINGLPDRSFLENLRPSFSSRLLRSGRIRVCYEEFWDAGAKCRAECRHILKKIAVNRQKKKLAQQLLSFCCPPPRGVISPGILDGTSSNE